MNTNKAEPDDVFILFGNPEEGDVITVYGLDAKQYKDRSLLYTRPKDVEKVEVILYDKVGRKWKAKWEQVQP